MTYYILPKTNNESPEISPVFFDTIEEAEMTVISNSVQLRRNILLNQIKTISRNNNKTKRKMFFKKNTEEQESARLSEDENESSSQLQSHANLTKSEFMEIIGIFNIYDIAKMMNHSFDFLNFSCLTSLEITSALNCHVKITSPKTSLQSYAVNLKRLNLDLDLNVTFFDTVHLSKSTDNYSHDLICALFVILKSTSNGGLCVIKMSTITFQLELDVVYILNYVFDKVYALKPDSSNVINNEKHIVCKHFLKKRSTPIIAQIGALIESPMKKHIGKLLLHDLPSTFLIKMEEINAIIGQKQMDGLCQMINTIKHKSMEDPSTNECAPPWHKMSTNHNAFNHRLSKHVGKPVEDHKLDKDG